MYRTIRRLWVYVPLPEPHVAGLVTGATLHVLRPRQLTQHRNIGRIIGLGLISCGLFVIGWAIWSVVENNSHWRRTLVTTGPYASSRNPMYVGWTLLYAGCALVLNATWLVVLLPAVMVATHGMIRSEEESLEQEFADEYRAYRRTVRRYL